MPLSDVSKELLVVQILYSLRPLCVSACRSRCGPCTCHSYHTDGHIKFHSLFPQNSVMKYFNALVARAANPPNSRCTVLHDGQPNRGHLLKTLPFLPGHDHIYVCSIGNVFSVSPCQGQGYFLRPLEEHT